MTDIWQKWLPHLRDTKRDYDAEDNVIYSSDVGVQKTPESEIEHQDGQSKQTICSVQNGNGLIVEPNKAKSGMKIFIVTLHDLLWYNLPINIVLNESLIIRNVFNANLILTTYAS